MDNIKKIEQAVGTQNIDYERNISVSESILPFLGRDQDGIPKSAIAFSLVDMSGKIPKELNNFTALDTSVEMISYVGNFLLISLEFNDPSNIWLKRTIGILTEFHETFEKSQICLIMTIANLDSEVDYYRYMANPLIFVRGYSDKTGRNTLVQIVFDSEQTDVISEKFDLNEIETEIQRELEYNDKLAEEESLEKELMTEQIMDVVNEKSPMKNNLADVRTSEIKLNSDDGIRFTEEE